MNSICLGQSFTLTSSNNNLRVSRSVSVILKTKSIAKYSKVLQTHDYYQISNHYPLFRLANTLKFSGIQYYVETKILISPHSVYFRQKASKVTFLYYLQTVDGAFIFSVAVKNIPSVIIYCFSVASFNFWENNMLQKLKQSRITQIFVLKPRTFLKDGEF